MRSLLKRLSLPALFIIFFVNAAFAGDALLKPFVLGSRGPGSVAEKAAEVKTAVAAQGFTIAGEYSPYADAVVIVATNDELKKTAAKSEHGGFGAAVRVSVTKVKDEVQVAYTNPAYMAGVYRMQGDLADVSARLAAALGGKEEFGAKGLAAKKLRSYHYMMGMEYFTDPSVLAEYGSFEEATAAVEAGLAAGKGGTAKVYRIDIPGKKEVVFGVAMKGATDADKYRDDKFIMSEIDFQDLKSTAHLPYEMLVSGNKVYALYARFRIAVSFPDLSMMGKNSFMNIMKSPEAIRKSLTQAAGGKI
jgi:hypothetical protein